MSFRLIVSFNHQQDLDKLMKGLQPKLQQLLFDCGTEVAEINFAEDSGSAKNGGDKGATFSCDEVFDLEAD